MAGHPRVAGAGQSKQEQWQLVGGLMKALVLIPTTTRPVIITAIRERRNLPASLVVAEGDFRALPISRDYDTLVGAAGPLGGLLGSHGLPSHELKLSEGFETGRSWEVPVSIAHVLVERGVELVKEPQAADLIVFATGAVDSDLGIVKERYFLSQKVANTAELLAKVRPDGRIVALLPDGATDGDGGPDARNRLAQVGADVLKVATVRDAVAAIERFAGLESLPAKADPDARRAPADRAEPVRLAGSAPPPARRRSRAGAVLGLALLGVAGGGAYLMADGRWPANLVLSAWLGQNPTTGPATGPTSSSTTSPTPGAATGPTTGPVTGPVDKATDPARKAGTEDSGGKERAPATPTDDPSRRAAVDPTPPPAPPTNGSAAPKPDGTDASTLKPADPTKTSAAAPTPSPGPPVPNPDRPETAKADDNLVAIEELRAPAGSNCIQVVSGERQPDIFVNKPKDGRFHISDANGLCALVFRRLDGAAALVLSVDEALLRATADFSTFGRGKVRLRPGDVARRVRDDFRTQMTYSVWLKSSTSAGTASEKRYVHELRR